MAKERGFAKAFGGRWRIVEINLTRPCERG
jgi:hypothetical protein